jgi:hypothetical protein
VLPPASSAVKVLVLEREQPSLVMTPSVEVTIGAPHASVAVAVPSAACIIPAVGLIPRLAVVKSPVNTGGAGSQHSAALEVTIDIDPFSVVDEVSHEDSKASSLT